MEPVSWNLASIQDCGTEDCGVLSLKQRDDWAVVMRLAGA